MSVTIGVLDEVVDIVELAVHIRNSKISGIEIVNVG
jgi:hypothetical protein